jgi:hypothetical protein
MTETEAKPEKKKELETFYLKSQRLKACLVDAEGPTPGILRFKPKFRYYPRLKNLFSPLSEVTCTDMMTVHRMDTQKKIAALDFTSVSPTDLNYHCHKVKIPDDRGEKDEEKLEEEKEKLEDFDAITLTTLRNSGAKKFTAKLERFTAIFKLDEETRHLYLQELRYKLQSRTAKKKKKSKQD